MSESVIIAFATSSKDSGKFFRSKAKRNALAVIFRTVSALPASEISYSLVADHKCVDHNQPAVAFRAVVAALDDTPC